MQRQKGANFERLLANKLKIIWPSARRGIGQSRSAKEVPDVDGTPLWIEAKHRARLNMVEAMNQAVEATDGRIPVVISRQNRCADMVTMRFDDWFAMVERHMESEQIAENSARVATKAVLSHSCGTGCGCAT